MPGLTLNQQLVFDAIDNDPGATVEEIADETGLANGLVLRALSSLERADLVFLLGVEAGRVTRYVTRGTP